MTDYEYLLDNVNEYLQEEKIDKEEVLLITGILDKYFANREVMLGDISVVDDIEENLYHPEEGICIKTKAYGSDNTYIKELFYIKLSTKKYLVIETSF